MSAGARSVLVRAVVALVAALLAVWFVVLWRDEQIGREAADRVFQQPGMSDADWARTLDQLRRAELLNPGTEWTEQRASALLLRDKRAALRLANSVVRQEPDYLDAWVTVYKAARGLDDRRAARAAAEIRRLNPPLPPR